MVLQRKTLALDEDIVNKLKEIARRRGTTLSNYLRSLFSEVIDIEERGYFAPKALRERKYEYILKNLGFIYIPKELVGNLRVNVVKTLGNRLGLILKELKVNVLDIIDILIHTNANVIVEAGRVALIAMPNTLEYHINKLIAEIAKEANLKVVDNDTLITIEIPKEAIEPKLSEFSRRKRRQPKT